MSQIRLIVGLGNPGKKYAGTRHNLGFVVLDELARQEKLAWKNSERHECELISWDRAGAAVLLAKPATYMNLSGRSVRSLADYFKITPAEVLAVCDDCDLPLGELRLRLQGSAGSHNGLQSVCDHLKTEDFPRLRLGIGPAGPTADLSDYVLSKFSVSEESQIENLTNRAVLAIKDGLAFSLEKAMNEFNRKQSET